MIGKIKERKKAKGGWDLFKKTYDDKKKVPTKTSNMTDAQWEEE